MDTYTWKLSSKVVCNPSFICNAFTDP